MSLGQARISLFLYIIYFTTCNIFHAKIIFDTKQAQIITNITNPWYLKFCTFQLILIIKVEVIGKCWYTSHSCYIWIQPVTLVNGKKVSHSLKTSFSRISCRNTEFQNSYCISIESCNEFTVQMGWNFF